MFSLAVALFCIQTNLIKTVFSQCANTGPTNTVALLPQNQALNLANIGATNIGPNGIMPNLPGTNINPAILGSSNIALNGLYPIINPSVSGSSSTNIAQNGVNPFACTKINPSILGNTNPAINAINPNLAYTNSASISNLGIANLASLAPVNANNAAGNRGFPGVYGGIGSGDISVAGEFGVSGATKVFGQVPVMGAVQFNGMVPAAGTVTIAAFCPCNCNGFY